MNRVLVQPSGTSWMSVIGGWIATIGTAALIAPAVAGIVASAGTTLGTNDIGAAVPVILGIFASYLIGGYVAGRMAGYRTSWHGLLTAFFGLFILLTLALLSYLADRGVFAGIGIRSLSDLGIAGLAFDGAGEALTFGALLGFVAAIFSGWLGGVLAPSHAVPAQYAPREAGPITERAALGHRDRTVRREEVRERRPLLPSFGRKGGDRVEERRVVEERREPDRDRS